MRLRSLHPLATMAALAAATHGCFIITDNGATPDPPSTTPDELAIDTNATMPVTAGAGAGLWIEYQTGGKWDVYTSCDSDLTSRPCAFDVILSVDPGVTLSAPTLHDHAPADTVELRADGSIRLITSTTKGLDGVTFITDPGAALQLDLLLDGQAQPTFLNWVSGGERVTGTDTTTNPVVFIPTYP